MLCGLPEERQTLPSLILPGLPNFQMCIRHNHQTTAAAAAQSEIEKEAMDDHANFVIDLLVSNNGDTFRCQLTWALLCDHYINPQSSIQLQQQLDPLGIQTSYLSSKITINTS